MGIYKSLLGRPERRSCDRTTTLRASRIGPKMRLPLTGAEAPKVRNYHSPARRAGETRPPQDAKG